MSFFSDIGDVLKDAATVGGDVLDSVGDAITKGRGVFETPESETQTADVPQAKASLVPVAVIVGGSLVLFGLITSIFRR